MGRSSSSFRTATRGALATLISLIPLTVARPSDAAAPWVDRPMTQGRLVFAGDVGLGIGHIGLPTPLPSRTGPGLNLEGTLGITHNVELGLRLGFRVGDDARAVQADSYGRTLWTETWGTRFDTVANPEARVRWAFVQGRVVEVGLDGRLMVPTETGSRVGTMIGLPLAFHIGEILRIDTGVYVPIAFYPEPMTAVSFPAYFWFQPSRHLWLGPMTSLRFVDPGPGGSYADVLLGFGLGYQVASAVDLKTMFFFPHIDDTQGGRDFGGGFGVQFRIGE